MDAAVASSQGVTATDEQDYSEGCTTKDRLLCIGQTSLNDCYWFNAKCSRQTFKGEIMQKYCNQYTSDLDKCVLSTGLTGKACAQTESNTCAASEDDGFHLLGLSKELGYRPIVRDDGVHNLTTPGYKLGSRVRAPQVEDGAFEEDIGFGFEGSTNFDRLYTAAAKACDESSECRAFSLYSSGEYQLFDGRACQIGGYLDYDPTSLSWYKPNIHFPTCVASSTDNSVTLTPVMPTYFKIRHVDSNKYISEAGGYLAAEANAADAIIFSFNNNVLTQVNGEPAEFCETSSTVRVVVGSGDMDQTIFNHACSSGTLLAPEFVGPSSAASQSEGEFEVHIRQGNRFVGVYIKEDGDSDLRVLGLKDTTTVFKVEGVQFSPSCADRFRSICNQPDCYWDANVSECVDFDCGLLSTEAECQIPCSWDASANLCA